MEDEREKNQTKGYGRLAVVGIGLLGGIAASSCCVLPLLFFSLGISGAWIGNLTALAPYKPYFITLAIICVGYGYVLVFKKKKQPCKKGEACERPLPNLLVKSVLFLATLVVAGVIVFPYITPIILGG